MGRGRADDDNRGALLSLQRELSERARGKILHHEQVSRPDFARYEREYAEDTDAPVTRTSFPQLVRAVVRSDVTLVGDYHTLVISQKTFVKIARRLRSKRVVLALEFFCAAHQPVLDKYLAGRIRERTLLKRTHYRERWPYDVWLNFRPILELARRRGWRVIGLDSNGHQDLRSRDEFMAKGIVDALAAGQRGTRVLVLVGELHLARSHLPAAVEAEAKRLERAPNITSVLQNVEPIYWQLAEEGREEEVVRLEDGRYCVLNTPPMVVHQSYLNWIEYEVDTLEYGNFEHDFKHLVTRVGKVLGVPTRRRLDELYVYAPGDLGFWAKLASLAGPDEPPVPTADEVQMQHSRVVLRHRMVYLGNLSINTVGETAARLLHCLELGVDEDQLEGFYAGVLHEALSFFGSKVVNPKRKCRYAPFFRQTLKNVGRQPVTDVSRLEVASAVLLHQAFERGRKVDGYERLWKLKPAIQARLARRLGCMLGERLYYAYARGRLSRPELRALLRFPLHRPESASALYFTLLRRVHRVVHPRRI